VLLVFVAVTLEIAWVGGLVVLISAGLRQLGL
jgi:hypothetical protein